MTTTLNEYRPKDHLVQVKTKQGMKDYYPAAYRLFELNLRYENANFSSEIVHLDPERDFVIVKCRLYLGASYDLSGKKAEAMKQGPLSQLDKIETAAKARCARDFGIGTEHALDFDEAASETPRMATEEQVKRLVAYADNLGYETPESLTFGDANQLLKEWYAEFQERRAS
jgi:hypothetical protein